jgi:uncharacterized protein YbjT (DUF2867 family)
MKHKNLLVLGASGACGRWVVQMGEERGHRITAVVRSSTKYERRQDIQVIEGNVLDADTVVKAMKGQHAVVSCLGIRRKTSNPWSAVVSPADFTSQSARIIMQAMQSNDVRRVVAISSAGVGTSWSRVGLAMKLLIRGSNIAVSFRDMAEMEKVYSQDGIDSLVVRPVGLVNKGQANKQTSVVARFGLSSQIARKDVATWMLDAIERPEPFETQAEMIGWV